MSDIREIRARIVQCWNQFILRDDSNYYIATHIHTHIVYVLRVYLQSLEFKMSRRITAPIRSNSRRVFFEWILAESAIFVCERWWWRMTMMVIAYCSYSNLTSDPLPKKCGNAHTNTIPFCTMPILRSVAQRKFAIINLLRCRIFLFVYNTVIVVVAQRRDLLRVFFHLLLLLLVCQFLIGNEFNSRFQ